MSFRDVLLFGFIFSMLPVAAFAPRFGVYLWYWIAFMAPHRLTWGPAYNFQFAHYTALATLAGLVLSGERLRMVWTRTTLLLAAFTAWVTITTQYAVNVRKAEDQWKQFLKIQLMVLITILVINNRKKIRALVWVVVASIGFYGVKGGIFTIVSGGQYLVWGPPEGMLAGNNELALGLVVTIPLMRYLQLTEPRAWARHALTGAMLLSGFAILGSHSRGAFLAAAIMTAALAAKSRRKRLLVPAVLVFGLVLFLFAPADWFARMETIQSYDEDASAMGRINAWHFAFNVAKDRPLVGGGFDVFTPEMFRLYAPDPLAVHDSHSIYFGVLGEHGFVGLGLFLLLGFSAWRAGTKVRRVAIKSQETAWAADLASMTQVGLIGYGVNGAFLGLAYFELAYTLISITVILQTLVLSPAPEAVAGTAAPAAHAIRDPRARPRGSTRRAPALRNDPEVGHGKS